MKYEKIGQWKIWKFETLFTLWLAILAVIFFAIMKTIKKRISKIRKKEKTKKPRRLYLGYRRKVYYFLNERFDEKGTFFEKILAATRAYLSAKLDGQNVEQELEDMKQLLEKFCDKMFEGVTEEKKRLLFCCF